MRIHVKPFIAWIWRLPVDSGGWRRRGERSPLPRGAAAAARARRGSGACVKFRDVREHGRAAATATRRSRLVTAMATSCATARRSTRARHCCGSARHRCWRAALRRCCSRCAAASARAMMRSSPTPTTHADSLKRRHHAGEGEQVGDAELTGAAFRRQRRSPARPRRQIRRAIGFQQPDEHLADDQRRRPDPAACRPPSARPPSARSTTAACFRHAVRLRARRAASADSTGAPTCAARSS